MTNCCPENEWSYDNQDQWACCYPLNFSLQTSPITIHTKFASYPAFAEFSLTYQDGNQPCTYVNSSHDLRFQFNSLGNLLSIRDAENAAILNNIHFHCPAEHCITDSQDGDVMEMHLVHSLSEPDHFPRQPCTNDPSKLRSFVAIGILLELSSTTSPEIAEMFTIISNGEPPSSEEIDLGPLSQWIDNHSKYYVYTGSLTIPPLPTVVQWFVMKDRLQISLPDLQKFQTYYSNNARYRDQGGPRCYTGCPRHPLAVTRNF